MMTPFFFKPRPAVKLLVGLLAVTVLAAAGFPERNLPVAKQLASPKASGFLPGDVRLLNGPFRESQDAEAKYLLSLDLDRLLAPFLTECGLKAKAAPYPGWETQSLPGVALSFYMAGASRLYRLTENRQFLVNLQYVLGELSRCQANAGGFLLGSRGGRRFFKKVETEGFFEDLDDWSDGCGEPYYVLEKLFSGLIDVYRIGELPAALQIATKLADWLAGHMSHISESELHKIMTVEYGGMNWVLADMYGLTGDARYLAMSKRWQDRQIVEPMTMGVDVLTGAHANTQFPKMSGLADRYAYTADPADANGPRFFWESVVLHRTYVTGGNSESEYFRARDVLRDTLTPFTSENCNSYNMLKLTALLNRIEPRVEYADYIERTLYNHILSAQNRDDGRICYHLPLMPGAEKFWRSLYDDFSCCVCSSMDSYTRHAEYVYQRSAADLYVNLFVASEVRWREKGITVRQETDFPFSDRTSLRFTCRTDAELGLDIRNPYWLAGPMEIRVNGDVLKLSPEAGYARINRRWRTGDLVEIRLPMGIRTEAMPDDRNRIAFFQGPVLLAGVLSKDAASDLVRGNVPPALLPGDAPKPAWLRPSGAPLEYTMTVARPGGVRVKPLFQVKTEPYSVYWQLVTEGEWNARLARRDEDAERLRRYDLRTFDSMTVGDEKSETDHGLTGDSVTGKGNSGILDEDAWREAAKEPGFGYRMRCPGDQPVTLLCRFMGRVQHERWDLQIKVDGTTIAELKRDKDDTYPVIPFIYTYEIPFALTKGRPSIEVTFSAPSTRKMPRLMQLRTLGADRSR
jgi:uncharacterized protein